jgi:hypothetical protein
MKLTHGFGFGIIRAANRRHRHPLDHRHNPGVAATSPPRHHRSSVRHFAHGDGRLGNRNTDQTGQNGARKAMSATTTNHTRLVRAMLEGQERRGAKHVLVPTTHLRAVLNESDRGWSEAARLAKLKQRRIKRQTGATQ